MSQWISLHLKSIETQVESQSRRESVINNLIVCYADKCPFLFCVRFALFQESNCLLKWIGKVLLDWGAFMVNADPFPNLASPVDLRVWVCLTKEPIAKGLQMHVWGMVAKRR